MNTSLMYVSRNKKEILAHIRESYGFSAVKDSHTITGDWSQYYRIYRGNEFIPDYFILNQSGLYKLLRKI